jgi:hypothetical protein
MFNSSKTIKKEEYISLLDASKSCNYSQEYLSLRARQGKLQAVKIGRNWVTTKEWLKEYINKTEEYKKEHSSKLKGINRLTPRFVLSFFVVLISLVSFWFIAEGKIGEVMEKIIDKTDVVLEDSSDFVHTKLQDFSLASVSETSSDGFFSKLINNASGIIKETTEEISFNTYKNVYRVDKSLLSIKKDFSNSFNNIKKILIVG